MARADFSVFLPGRIARTCEQCSAPFYVQPAKLAYGPCRFCSRDCRVAFKQAEHERTFAARFWLKVERSGECWTWRKAKSTPGGYGLVKRQGQMLYAHRVAWWLATGHWPTDDDDICHNCPSGDNPSCVRNDDVGTYEFEGRVYERHGHLWLGTTLANNRDALAKGHYVGRPVPPPRHGEQHAGAKLTEDQVREIRAIPVPTSNPKGRGGTDWAGPIADKYGVSPSLIRAIVRHRAWRHVD